MRFDEAARKYRPALLRRAEAWSPSDAEDIVQNALLQAWRYWGDDVGNPWHRLYTNLRWAFARMLGEAAANKRGRFVPFDEADEPTIEASQETVADAMMTLRSLDKLIPSQRDTLLALGAGDTLTEIAATRGLTHQRIAQLAGRARHNLRSGQRRHALVHEL